MPPMTVESSAALVPGAKAPAATRSVLVLRPFWHAGACTTAGDTVTLPAGFAVEMISAGKAELAAAATQEPAAAAPQEPAAAAKTAKAEK